MVEGGGRQRLNRPFAADPNSSSRSSPPGSAAAATSDSHRPLALVALIVGKSQAQERQRHTTPFVLLSYLAEGFREAVGG